MRRDRNYPCAIYALYDPRDRQYRYIGASNWPETRIKHHTWEAKVYDRSAKCLWLRDLAADGVKPELEVIEWCDPSIADKREKGWIFWYASQGADLTNGNTPKGMRGKYLQEIAEMRRPLRKAASAYGRRRKAERQQRADTPGAGQSAPERTAEGTGGQDEEVLR